MLIDDKLILKLEQLARISLNSEERQRMKIDLEKMLELCKKLDEVDTENDLPLQYLGNQVQKAREDEVGKMLPREKVFQNAPDADGKFFRVPKVIKGN